MKPASEGITRCIRASRGSARSVNVPGAAAMPAASLRISTVFTGSSPHPGLMASPLLATSPTVVRRAPASPTSPVRVDLRHAASAQTAIVPPGPPPQPAPGHGADHTDVGAGAAQYQASDDGLEMQPSQVRSWSSGRWPTTVACRRCEPARGASARARGWFGRAAVARPRRGLAAALGAVHPGRPNYAPQAAGRRVLRKPFLREVPYFLAV